MLSVKIGSSIIPTDPGISLPLVLRSPLFLTGEGKVPGSYIFNNSVPADDAIRKEYNQAHRVQRHGRATAELPYSIRHGSLHYQGMVILTQADENNYDVAFKIDNSEFLGRIFGKTLKDLNWGPDKIISPSYSYAHTMGKNEYVMDRVGVFTLNVQGPDTIDANVAGEMSLGGKTFTSGRNGTCTQTITIIGNITTGSLHITAKKNGVLYLDEILVSGPSIISISFPTDLVLVTSDVITIDLACESELKDSGQSVDIFIDTLTVEYSSGNIYDDSITQDQYTSDFVVFPLHNAELLSNFPDDAFELDNLSIKTLYTQYFPVCNYFKNGKFPFFLSGDIEGEAYYVANLFTPFVYMRTILTKIANESGYSIVNNPFDTLDFKGAVLFNASAENNYATLATTLLPVKTNFNLTDHVPATKQSDFINWIAQLTGCMPVVDNNELTITFVDLRTAHIATTLNPTIDFPGILQPNSKVMVDSEFKGIKLELKMAGSDKYLSENIKSLNDKLVFRSAVSTVADLPNAMNYINEMYYIISLNEYWVYQYDPETYSLAFRFYSKKFPLVYIEGIEPLLQVVTEYSPVLTSQFADTVLGAPANRKWTIPITKQPGILEGFPESLNSEYGLQILIYKGMSTDSLGQTYPLGSSRVADYSPAAAGSTDLNAESIFITRYKEFLRWLAYDAKPATFPAIITPGQLQQIKFPQIYKGNGFSFLVKEIRVNMLQDGLSMAEVDVYIC